MEVKLSPELERKVRERVGGAYGSPSDVVEEAQKSFFGPESLSRAEIDHLDRHLAMGMDDVARGDVIDGPVALKAAIARLGRRHKG
jgi:Arc/MetJ-type ribon-helix-helix transcriptional regulator